MKLVNEHDPILRTICDPFDFNESVMDPYELAKVLHEIRRKDGGVGLAAPQIGINTRALVIGIGDFTSEGVEDYDQVFFNPTILESSQENIYMMEGCLSYPELFIKIKRPKDIVLEWYTEEDTVCRESFGGMTSRILQHEVDHLNGITFLRRVNRFHLDKAKKELKSLKRKRKKG